MVAGPYVARAAVLLWGRSLTEKSKCQLWWATSTDKKWNDSKSYRRMVFLQYPIIGEIGKVLHNFTHSLEDSIDLSQWHLKLWPMKLQLLSALPHAQPFKRRTPGIGRRNKSSWKMLEARKCARWRNPLISRAGHGSKHVKTEAHRINKT